MDTLTKSCSPTIVITVNGEVQTNEEATVYVKELDIFLTLKVLENTPESYRSESFAMNTDTLTSGSTVKNHISLKTVFGYSVIRRTSYQSWFLVYQRVLPQACLLQHPWHLQGRKLIILRLPQAHLPQHPWHLQRRLIIQITLQQSCQVKVWIDKYGETRILLNKTSKIQKPNENENADKWLQEFRENLVDDRVPEHRDSHAGSSHEPSLETMRSADLGKHSIYTHFP